MRYFLYLVFFALALPPLRARAGGELPRAGAPRPLRLLAADGAPLPGFPRDVAWERRGGGVFFTLERDGTRNIWRAFPDPQDDSRFPAWRALPVTSLRAPRFAAQPAPLPGDRALVCVSNALAPAPATGAVSQVVRYDFESSTFRALSDAIVFYDSPQVSPDGKLVAFAGGRGAEGAVYQASADNPRGQTTPFVTRLATRARRPVWLDGENLLVESLDARARGLYWMPAKSTPAPPNAAASNFVVGGGGEAQIVGADGIVFCAKTSSQAPTNLYLVARDGSGLRELAATANARRPAAAPDGQMLAYDAPQGEGNALWVMPLLGVKPLLSVEDRVATRLNVKPMNAGHYQVCADAAPEYDGPSASLSAVRATPDGAIAILGSWRSALNPGVTLEVGRGGKPKQWENLSVIVPADAAPADAQGNRVLATWNPPARARGDWTLRLSLRGLGGGAQSLLRVRLPLATGAPVPLPPPIVLPGAPPNLAPADAAVTRPADGGTSPLPRATPLPALPDVEPVRGPFSSLSPVYSPVPIDEDVPDFPSMQAPENSSMPAPASDALAPEPTTAGVEIVPIDPARIASPVAPVAIPPTVGDDPSGYGERPNALANARFAAQFDVVGTPARMAPREKVKVTLRAINRGVALWQSGSDGADRVRLVARWIDFSTGTRRQWNFFWLDDSVAPGERTSREIEVAAPARPGKYKLIYGLVHLPANGEYKAPPYSAPQENWDDEFGAIAFAVEVAGN